MTDVKLGSLFSTLENSAKELNSITDSCNKTLQSAQDRLVSLNVGIEYWFDDPIHRSDLSGDVGPNDVSTEYWKHLGFCKIDGVWVLGVKEVRHASGFYQGDLEYPFTSKYVDNPPVPILNSSRELRLSACDSLADFLSAYGTFFQAMNKELSEGQSA